MAQELTTLICLYHSRHHAQTAMEKIVAAGISESNITMVGAEGSDVAASRSSLAGLDVLWQQFAVGVLISVAALADHIDTVEDIFKKYAGKIDEVDIAAPPPVAAVPAETAIPIVEEEMTVGKRTVDAGGVRVYRRVVEIPVEESISLREEHVSVDRHAVDRAVTDADLLTQGNRVIELTETAEEAVVGKSARVVEEVRVGKETAARV